MNELKALIQAAIEHGLQSKCLDNRTEREDVAEALAQHLWDCGYRNQGFWDGN